ncbi:MAG: hypothetical protein HYX21_00665 [Candidatus Yanofskybacteria bacterium]|nr:hypothetical protein [Candidatus Yanofskybacteria bacterium]
MKSTEVIEYEYPKTPYWFVAKKDLNSQPQQTLELVKHTPKEQLLGRVEHMQKNNLTAVQINRIKDLKFKTMYYFKELTERYFGLSREQILQLPDKELEVLFALVYKRARRASVYTKIQLLLIPIFGWIFLAFTYYEGERSFPAIRFISSLCKIKKIMGHEFNPVEAMRNDKFLNLSI